MDCWTSSVFAFRCVQRLALQQLAHTADTESNLYAVSSDRPSEQFVAGDPEF